jgi:hypothetical protein
MKSAQVCLRLLGRGCKVPLHVFIAGSRGDTSELNKPLAAKIIKLVKLLSEFSSSIARCQLWDPSDKMCRLLQGHAPTMEYLSIGVTRQTSIFSGSLPGLRTMLLTTSNTKLWRPSNFPALVSLGLAYAGDPRCGSLKALIGLLQSLPQLQHLRLTDFCCWDKTLPKSKPELTMLLNLSFANCDFAPVLQYLRTPNLQFFLIDGFLRGDDATPLQFFEDPELLWRVQKPPILGMGGLCDVVVIVRMDASKRSVVIKMSSNTRRFLVRLEWSRWGSDWERWVENSWRNLLQRSRFSSSISLTIDFPGSSVATFCPVFAAHSSVETLTFAGGSLGEILQYLGVFDRSSYPLRFPALKFLDLTAYTSLSIEEGNQIRSYMQFRANANAPMEVAIWSSAWREARGYPWTSFMIAYNADWTTSLVLRQEFVGHFPSIDGPKAL